MSYTYNIPNVQNDSITTKIGIKNSINKIIKQKNDILFSLLKIINIDIDSLDKLNNCNIERDLLMDDDVIEQYYKFIPKLKEFYNSDELTCLHKNSLQKQKFPAINMLRQILKASGFLLKPKVVCLGYVGKDKITKRYFIIENNITI